MQPIKTKTKTDDDAALTTGWCTDEWDCSLAGSCGSDGLCVCDSGWRGPTCAMVAFDPAPSIGYAFRPGHGFTTWGGSPIQADNHSMYYLFASVNVHGTLSDWWNTSVIVTASSTSAAGPYHWDRKTVTIGPKLNNHAVRPSSHIDTHQWDSVAVQNPVVVRLKKGAGFVLYYAGSNLTTPHYGMNNSAIMAAYATSLDGPWETSEQPVLVPFTSPESWEAGSVCNPAAHVHDDNSVTLAYRGYWDNNGVAFAWAPSWRGPFRRLYGGSGLFAERPTLEDPFLISSPRGFHVLMHYFKADNCSNTAGGRQCALVGNHAFSRAAPRPSADGASGADGTDTEFFLAPNRGAAAGGYGLDVAFANGTAARFSHREEPKMLLEWSEAAGDYVPTHLFNVVVEKQEAPADGWAHLEVATVLSVRFCFLSAAPVVLPVLPVLCIPLLACVLTCMPCLHIIMGSHTFSRSRSKRPRQTTTAWPPCWSSRRSCLRSCSLRIRRVWPLWATAWPGFRATASRVWLLQRDPPPPL